MKLVYVAGPFRGPSYYQQEMNIRAAEAAALEVWRVGAACICPHTNTRFFQGAADDEVWLEGDLEILKRCDAVLMTVGWTVSSGARAEHNLAIAQGIPVFYTIETLKQWLEAEKEAAA